ncbi:MAG: Cytochrome oxidase, cbb3-type, subunit, partial [Chloroflexota bacterium]|nr:Cytochrome oxidase, cbb3-type, subunit [Chloroflexota bacterium]
MTDTPGREPAGPEPEPEQRLPATRPPAEVAPVERFTSPPSIRAVELTPERAAQVVRQSSNARWIGFLAVVVVILFVALYWFYELGAPLGLTKPRLQSEITAQQITMVERGYNVYQANCARCHGAKGQGGIGPVLNEQDKLFSHLNENYIRNVLTVGGRYVCGDPKSLMPVWADTGKPPGPLNYRQIDELVAFLMANNDQTYIVRDEHLLDPKKDPITGQVLTFTGWRDPNYKPAPGATPFPDCWKDAFASASSAPSAPAASTDPNAKVVTITAQNIAFTTATVTAPAGAAFTLSFDNQDAGIPHDVQIKDATGA